MYVSEATEFLRQLKKARPELEAEQRRGRALLWDKEPLTPDEMERLKASTVAQQGYVYQVKG